MKQTRTALAFLFAGLLLFSFCAIPVRAQDDEVQDDPLDDTVDISEEVNEEPPIQEEEEPIPREFIQRPHPLTDIPESSPDVTTTVLFPEIHGSDFPIGKPIAVLVGFVNNGPEELNLSFAMGSLNNPMQFDHFVQNFTKRDFNTTLPPYSEITLAYRFMTYIDLEPTDYTLALTVFYETVTDEYASTFFNQTIRLYEERSNYDFQTISSFVLLFVIIAGIIYLIFGNKKGRSKSKKSADQSKPEDWLSETLINQQQGKAGSPKKGSKSKAE